MSPLVRLALLGASALFSTAVVAAEVPAPPVGKPPVPGAEPVPKPGDPTTTVPEKMEPAPNQGAAPGTSGESLSDKLDRSNGVITPPATGAPDMRVPAPNPEPNTTPVIPPPGSPGNPSPVIPK